MTGQIFLLIILAFVSVVQANTLQYAEDKSQPESKETFERVKRENRDYASFLTYNLGMAPAIAEYSERQNHLSDFAANLDADVVCLQEVWYMRDMKTIIDNARDYNYSFSFYHSAPGSLRQDAGRRPCGGVVGFGRTAFCFGSRCNRGSPIERLVCARDRCGLLELEQECMSCLMLSGGSAYEIGLCLTGFRSINSVGLLVLSKIQISDSVASMFNPGVKQILPRGHIDFNVQGIGNVLCTHLTSHLGPAYIGPSSFDSYQEQHEFEINTLIGTDYDVILGDLNTGRGNPEYDIDEELSANYQLILDSGYTSPAEILNRCTWCGDNPIVNKTRKLFIDHIIVPMGTRTENPEVTHTENLLGNTCPLSDHYGVKLTVFSDNPGSIQTVRPDQQAEEPSFWERLKYLLCFFC